jgi:hypothetical protein
MKSPSTRSIRYLLLPIAMCAAASGCGGGDSTSAPALPTTAALETACPGLTSAAIASALPVANTTIATAVLVAASAPAPEQCQVDGVINPRTGTDGQTYGIHFRLRMPTATWNGRFFMGGGGGTDGSLVDPVAQAALGYATIGTDSGHNNTTDSAVNAGGSSSFGADYQARVDFAYNSYDQVTQVGKALVNTFYQQAPSHSYFMGCSEGGREGLLMTQRFPDYYDGVIAGDPVLHIPLGPLSGLYTTKLFAGLAQRGGLTLANGDPAIAKTYSDPDLLLVRNAILSVCDSLDGLADGIVDNPEACTPAVVSPALAAVQCTGAKTGSCLTADQIGTLQTAFAGAVNSEGTQLYSDWQWDAGIGGLSGTTYNPTWRSWWLGSFASATNNATKLAFATAEAVIYTTPPVLPITNAQALSYSLNYNFDADPIKIYSTAPGYPQSTASMTFTDSLDLSAFKSHGGKLMIYQGGSDPSVSIKDTLRWYDAMNVQMGSNAQGFARFFRVPGMNHCSGGPATDSFDMLPQLVSWVEQGVAPDSVIATASNPGYFGVAARTRPLCPRPKQSHYIGSGDINDAANFVCQ